MHWCPCCKAHKPGACKHQKRKPRRSLFSWPKVGGLIYLWAIACMAQTNQIPELPDSSSPWDDSTVFWAGLTLGFVWGGVAWIFRLVRQTAKQNPEI